jgi:hypothetical protein
MEDPFSKLELPDPVEGVPLVPKFSPQDSAEGLSFDQLEVPSPVVLPEKNDLFPPEKQAITAGGGVLGAVVGGGRGIAKRYANMIGEAVARGGAKSPTNIIAAESNLPRAGGPLATTPVGGKGTMNWARAFGMDDPEAMRARSMAEANQMNKAAMEAEDKIRSLWGGEGAQYKIDPSRASLMLNPESTVAKKSTAQMIRELIAKNPEFVKFLSSSARGLGNVLSGAGSAYEGMEALERIREKDPVGAALSGISSVSGLGALFAPASIPVTAPISVLTGLGAAGRQLSKKYGANELERLFPLRTGLEQEPSEEERQRATQPYFGRRMIR